MRGADAAAAEAYAAYAAGRRDRGNEADGLLSATGPLIWFVLSFGAAVTQAVQFAVVKGRARVLPPLVIVAWTQGVAFVGWLLYFVVTDRPLVAPGRAWPAIFASTLLVMGMAGLLARASARGDISVVGPVFALSPVFTIVPDALLSGTVPTALGWLGLALAVTGTVSLSRGGASGGSLRSFFTRPDARDALGAAIFLGGLSAVDRWAALQLGPPSYLLYSHGLTTLVVGTIASVTTPRGVAASVEGRNLVAVVAHGVLGLLGTGMQTSALTMAPASYVNAVRRLSALIAVVLGGALFREADVGRRLMAALLACAGAGCLLLAR
jgi:drug/metabolite transporter (DMT)-like permease